MRKTVVSLLFLSLCMFLTAQKPVQKAIEPTPLTTAQIQSTNMTVEQLLGLPSIYTVLNCDISIAANTNVRALFRVWYAKDGSKYCPNANASNFAKLWEEQISKMAYKGTRITIGDIKVQKGDKEMKCMPKSFVVP